MPTSKVSAVSRDAKAAAVLGPVILGLLVVFAYFYQGQAGEHGIQVWWGVVTILAWLAMCLFGALRWNVLLREQGIVMPFRAVWETWTAGALFLSGVFPSRILADAYRWMQSARISQAPGRALAVILCEKVLSLASLFILFMATVPIAAWYVGMKTGRFESAVLGGVWSAGACTAVLLVLRPRTIRHILQLLPAPPRAKPVLVSAGNALSAWEDKPRPVGMAVLWGVLLWAARMTALASMILAFRGVDFSVATLCKASLLTFARELNWTSVYLDVSSFVLSAMTPRLLPQEAFSSMAVTATLLKYYAPFGIGFPIFVWQALKFFGASMETVAVTKGLAASRVHGAMSAADLREQRRTIARTLAAGLGAGAVAGALTGLAESVWLVAGYVSPTELRVLWWGPMVYGPLLSLLGLAIAGLGTLVCLMCDRFIKVSHAFALCFSGTLFTTITVIGRFRVARDLLNENLMTTGHILWLALTAVSVGLGALWLCWVLFSSRETSMKAGVIYVASAYGALVFGGSIAAFMFGGSHAGAALSHEAKATGPNVILVVADTLRADYLPLHSAKAKARTPAFEAFARDAVVFDEGYAQAPWTKPSFATLFTGLYPSEHGAVGKSSVLTDRARTVAEILLEEGYYTVGFPNNQNVGPSVGFGQGFVEYRALEPDLPFGAAMSVQPMVLYEVLRRVRSAIMSPYVDVLDFYQPAPMVNRAVEQWIGNRPEEDRPFFLFVHYMDTHDPHVSPDNERIGYSLLELGGYPDPAIYLDLMRAAYVHEVEILDTHLGKLFDALKTAGLYEDSLIVFTSDHGEEFFEHKGWWHAMTHFDEQLHVPIIVKLPGNVAGGERNAHLARHVDVALTILTIAGAEVPDSMVGLTLLGEDGTAANAATTHSFAESDFKLSILRSIRGPSAKVIRSTKGNPRGLLPVEMYDLEGDPEELRNIAGGGDPREEQLLERMRSVEAAFVPLVDEARGGS